MATKLEHGQDDDLMSMGHWRAHLWENSLDILDAALLRAIQVIKRETPELSYTRKSPTYGSVVYRFYWDMESDVPSSYLGEIEIRKMHADVSDVAIRRVATGERAISFEKVVTLWKGHIESDKEVVALVQERSKASSSKNKEKNSKQRGRYRLTDDEIKRRKQMVKKANHIFKESNPKKTWKQIAYELDVPERTLRSWRHDPRI